MMTLVSLKKVSFFRLRCRVIMLIFFPDSIAGQMAALRGAPTASDAKPKSRRRQVTEESDSESGTDEDEDTESETDTDTDTDEE